ncbi:MAG: radical SAM protein [Conexivisphaera sp.]|jgi:MoaA/NifB/PqqE/SkfB family radical SAM enzyme
MQVPGGPRTWLRAAKKYAEHSIGRTPAPMFASYFVTYRCNLKCKFCFIRRDDSPELDTQGAREVVRRICATGVPTLDFSGGEPFLRPDMEELGALSREMGCITGVNTNGTVIDERRAARAANSFDYITISIDGPEGVHDEIRGAKGTYARARNAMKVLRDAGARVGVSSVVMPSNAEGIIRALDDLRGLYEYVIVQAVMPPEGPSGDGVHRLISRLEEMKSSGLDVLVPRQFLEGIPDYLDGRTPKICDAMRLYFAVDPMGQLLACGARTDITMGSVLNGDILGMLSRPPQEAVSKVENCGGCWIACTTGTSLAVRNPISYLRWTV